MLSPRRPSLEHQRPLVWAFVPYAEAGRGIHSPDYDTVATKRELAEAFAALGLSWIWQPVTPASAAAAAEQAAQSAREGPAIVFNFCDGLDVDGYPGLSVLHELERHGLPYTGADLAFYACSSSKLAMKERFVAAGVATARYEVLPPDGDASGLCKRVGAPVIVKPDASSGGSGLCLASVASSDEAVRARRAALGDVHGARVYAESFVPGREFTVLVLGDAHGPEPTLALPPVELVYHPELDAHERIHSYQRAWGLVGEDPLPPDGGPLYTYAPVEPRLASAVRTAARRAYAAVGGTGYGRVDLRQDRRGRLLALEVNANCGLSADHSTHVGPILEVARLAFPDLLGAILERALVTRREACA